MTFIYALKCPESGAVKYIGKADKPVQRLAAHIRSARIGEKKHATAQWILSVLHTGRDPVLQVLFGVVGETWQAAEIRTIADFRAQGFDLCNRTAGGNGLNVLRPEDRLAINAAMSAAWNEPGARERRVAALLAGNAKPEARARRLRSAQNPATRAKHAASLAVGLFGNPEVMARRRASQTAASNRPDVKAAKGAASKARWADPEFRARMHEKQVAAWIQRKQRSV